MKRLYRHNPATHTITRHEQSLAVKAVAQWRPDVMPDTQCAYLILADCLGERAALTYAEDFAREVLADLKATEKWKLSFSEIWLWISAKRQGQRAPERQDEAAAYCGAI